MHFHEKLDFLMNITKTTNSVLSLNISLDPSYISRLRRGRRPLPQNGTYIKSMAAYFARHCHPGHRLNSLLAAMNVMPGALDTKTLPELIQKWLTEEKSDEIKTVESFLAGFSSAKPKALPQHNKEARAVPSDENVSVYYGTEGKRQAVMLFLSQVLAQKEPRDLLLFSDEDMDWLTGDPQFTAKWAYLMSQVIAGGSRIKIIHTVSRNLDEMLSGIINWMPLYMTGAIEPYFYPKKRDGIFKNTFFVAPETAAVISNSVSGSPAQTANLFFKDKKTVASYAAEYNRYLSLCKPLMRIFTHKDSGAYISTLLEFEKEKTAGIVTTKSLCSITMPESAAATILARIRENNIDFAALHRQRTEMFEENIKTESLVEIIRLPDIESVKGGMIPVSFSDMLENGKVFYTPGEYILHLEYIAGLLDARNNYHVHIVETPEIYTIYAKEDLGALVAKTTAPPICIAMNENNMAAAFWDFLINVIGEKAYRRPNDKDTAARLQSYIRLLRENLG